MLVPMSTVTPQGAYCFHCGGNVDGDILEHVSTAHGHEAPKPKMAIKSWQHRLDDVVKAIEEIRTETDRTVQIQRLDKEVIEELYHVRAKLNETRRISAQVKG
jgi:hypothetical protein